MKHVMIDTETLSVSTKPAILSIGAVVFDVERNMVLNYIYVPIKGWPPGFDVSQDTVSWWSINHPEEFNRLMQEVERDGCPPQMALKSLDRLVKSTKGPTAVWSNGADADLVWLKSAYEHFDMDTPWGWSDVRCFRTLKEIAFQMGKHEVFKEQSIREVKEEHSYMGEHHALFDAMVQANYAIRVFKELKK